MPRSMNDALREAFESAPSVQAAQQQASDSKDQVDELGDEEQIEDQAVESVADDDDEVTIESANDLPQILGIEPEDFYALKLKLDGADPVPLGEIKDRLQQVESERQSLAQERESFQEQQQQFQQQALQYGQASQAVSQKMQAAWGRMSAIQESYPALQAQWAQREKEDPGAVALERQRIGEQYSAAQQELQAAQMEAQQEQAKAYDDWIADQHRILSRAVPDWAIPEKRKGLQERLARFAIEQYGVSADEFGKIDARTIQMLIDAERGVQAKKGAESAVKKIKAGPKALPKGARVKGAAQRKQRVQESIERARRTRTRGDVIAATRSIIEDAKK